MVLTSKRSLKNSSLNFAFLFSDSVELVFGERCWLTLRSDELIESNFSINVEFSRFLFSRSLDLESPLNPGLPPDSLLDLIPWSEPLLVPFSCSVSFSVLDALLEASLEPALDSPFETLAHLGRSLCSSSGSPNAGLLDFASFSACQRSLFLR